MNLKLANLKAIINKEKYVNQVAIEMNVSRQTVHKWLLRFKRFGVDGLLRKSKRRSGSKNRTPFAIEQVVIQLAHTHWHEGVQTLCDLLTYEYNITLHPVTIWRILKRNDVRYTTYQPETRKRWKKKLYAHQIPGRELHNGYKVSIWLQTRKSNLYHH